VAWEVTVLDEVCDLTDLHHVEPYPDGHARQR
jgi:hypothetical protein